MRQYFEIHSYCQDISLNQKTLYYKKRTKFFKFLLLQFPQKTINFHKISFIYPLAQMQVKGCFGDISEKIQQIKIETKVRQLQSMNNNKQTKFLSGDRQLYQKYTIRREKVIGKGNSYVYEVQDQNGNVQCVKQVRLQDNMSEFIFRKEVQLLGKLKLNPHPNIVEYKGSYCLQEKNQFKSRKGYIHMQKGITNLKQFLQHRKDKNQYFSEDEVLNFITSMLDVFTHLQKIQLAHRDVKPSNILIFQQDPLFFKVCDVGAGTAVGVCDMTQNRTVIGTPYYLSPELFVAYRQKQHLTNYKVYKSDCYSLGLVILEFCTLKRIEERLVREKQNIQSSIAEIKKRYPNIVGVGKVLRRMLDENVKTRYDFIELEAYINQHDLLRSKINSEIKLDPELVKKLVTSRELVIQKFEQLSNIGKIISSGNKAPTVRINLTTSDGVLKKSELEMMDQLKNIRHVNLEELDLKMQLCEIEEKQAELIAFGIQKNYTLKNLCLNLWNNKIKNQGFKHILTAVQSILPNLQQLSLYVPNNGIKLNPSFQELFNLTNATVLHTLRLNLGFNEINSQFFPSLMKGLSLCPHLQILQLTLQRTRLNHIHFNKGIKQLQKLKQLNELYINASDNSIRDEGVFGICDLMDAENGIGAGLKQLTLILRNAEIGDKGLHQLSKSMLSAYKLTTLKLNMIGNQLTQKGLKFASFQNMKSLNSLNLNVSNNKICDLGIKTISISLITLISLNKLKLTIDDTEITQKGCHYIGRLISQLPHLHQLDLSLKYNNIQLKGVQCVCTGLLSTKKLKKLRLVFQGTKIGDYAANYLATCLLKIRTLVSVDLNMENCDLGQTTMENITKLVKQCSKKAEEITISMRKNKQIRMDLYEQIKKELNNSRIAIRVDHPSTLEYSQTS